MWENLKKAAVDMIDGLESIPESVNKFLDDLKRDIEEMESKLNFFFGPVAKHLIWIGSIISLVNGLSVTPSTTI